MKKVKAGDPLCISATTFNTFVDAARDFLSRRQGTGGRPSQSFRQTGIVLLQNDSGADAPRFAALGIDSPVIDPGDNEDEFTSRVALSGVTPVAGTHEGLFAVCLEPIADGEIGRACVSGVCPAVVNVTDASHQYADIADGQVVLTSCSRGAAQVLWRETGTGLKWAVVRIGATSPAAGDVTNPVVLGGSGVTADTATWDIDNQPIGYHGVQFNAIRLYWSGSSGDPVYQFIRTPTYDSLGNLVAVSAEVRSTAFDTGPCAG